jgi:hypothetical protein
MKLGYGEEKCMQNINGEIYWKSHLGDKETDVRTTKTVYLRQICCENGRHRSSVVYQWRCTTG